MFDKAMHKYGYGFWPHIDGLDLVQERRNSSALAVDSMWHKKGVQMGRWKIVQVS